MALAGATLALGLAVVQPASAADKRTDIDCAELFKQLNTSNSGQLSAAEAATNPLAQKAYSDPTVKDRGYLTQSEFNTVCVGSDQTPASGQQ
jgi:hypothetical protein